MSGPGGDESRLTDAERRTLSSIARYQFGPDLAEPFLDGLAVDAVSRRRSGRVDRVYVDGDRLVSVTTHGRLTLGPAGAVRVHRITDPPANRVVVDAEARPFVAAGETAFARFVERVDPLVRPYDEVVVVDGDDTPLATGRAELSAAGMVGFDRGMAVDVRAGLAPSDDAD